MITAEDLDALGYYDMIQLETHKTPIEMVKEYAKVSKQKPDAYLYENLIEEEYNEWLDANASGSWEEELKELADLLYVIYGYSYAKRWDVGEALRRVHKNNMGRMYQPDGTIKRRADGKIEKNKDYPKVDLSDLVK